jgi:hypothetical protein
MYTGKLLVSQSKKGQNDINILGLLTRGIVTEMMENAPFMSPAHPRPDTALPTMNMLDEVATAQSKDPSSKTAKKQRKVHL